MFDSPDHKMMFYFSRPSPINNPYQPSLSAALGSLNGGVSLAKARNLQSRPKKISPKKKQKEK
jgi:hypothetical protein